MPTPRAEPGPRASLPLFAGAPWADGAFDATVQAQYGAQLRRGRTDVVQVNVGKLCNMACLHCHVEAGPARTEQMTRETAAHVLRLLDENPKLGTLDLTGGAPELNPQFRYLVEEARRRGRRVIDRCNLSVLFEPGQDDLAEFLARHQVHVVASLPCYSLENVDAQRGKGAFDRSLAGLRRLNALGYGAAGSALSLDLVYNPVGATLPPAQAALEARYRDELARRFDIVFHRLLTITNMPIRRFAHQLEREGKHDAYMHLLVENFNPSAVPGLMCRSLLSVGWDGRIHDCDFNQMLDLRLGVAAERQPQSITELGSLDVLRGARIHTGSHCYGCTAGAGSSCSGATT